MASRRDLRDCRGASLTVRIYERKDGAGDRGRTGDVQHCLREQSGQPVKLKLSVPRALWDAMPT